MARPHGVRPLVLMLLMLTAALAGCVGSDVEEQATSHGRVVLHVAGGPQLDLGHANLTLGGAVLGVGEDSVWTLSTRVTTVDLVQGPGAVTVVNATAPPGRYDLLRVPVVNGTAEPHHGNATHLAVPGSELRVRGPIPVHAGGSTHLVLNLSDAILPDGPAHVVTVGSADLRVVDGPPPAPGTPAPAPAPEPKRGKPAPRQLPVTVAFHGFNEPRVEGVRVHVDTVELRLGAGNASRWVTLGSAGRTVDVLRYGDAGSRKHLATSRVDAGGNLTGVRLWADHASRLNGTGAWVPLPTAGGPVVGTVSPPVRLGEATRVVVALDGDRSLVAGPRDGNLTDSFGTSWALVPEVAGVEVQPWNGSEPPGSVVDAARAGVAVNATANLSLEEVHLRVRQATVLGTGPGNGTASGEPVTVWNGSRWVDLRAAASRVPGVTLGHAAVATGNVSGVALEVDQAWVLRNGSRVNLTVEDGTVALPAPGRVPVDRTVEAVLTVDVGASVRGSSLDLTLAGVTWRDAGDDPS